MRDNKYLVKYLIRFNKNKDLNHLSIVQIIKKIVNKWNNFYGVKAAQGTLNPLVRVRFSVEVFFFFLFNIFNLFIILSFIYS